LFVEQPVTVQALSSQKAVQRKIIVIDLPKLGIGYSDYRYYSLMFTFSNFCRVAEWYHFNLGPTCLILHEGG